MATSNVKEPYRNFRFLVEIDGIVEAGFCEVIMPVSSVDVIEYREGNETGATARKIAGARPF